MACERQSAGRGRLGRSWQSTPGGSLTFTVALGLERQPEGLSLAVAAGLADVLRSHGCAARVKWPNDLVGPAGGKLAGILIEILNRPRRAAIGVGVNLSRSAALDKVQANWECLYDSIMPIDRNALLADLAAGIAAAVAAWQAGGWSSCRRRWLELCVHAPGETLAVSMADGSRRQLRFTGLGDAGELVGVDARGRAVVVASGEIVADAAGD